MCKSVTILWTMGIVTVSKYVCPILLFVQVGTFFFSFCTNTSMSHYLNCLFLIQIVWSENSVMLLNPPEEVVPDHRLKVLYSCDKPATVQLHCLVSFETGAISTLLLRTWSCNPGDPRTHTLRLGLPDWLVYQPDGTVPDSQWVLSCILRASIRYRGLGDSEKSAAAQDVVSLEPKPHFSRPLKQHNLCFSWSKQMLRLTQRFTKNVCPMEQGKFTEEFRHAFLSFSFTRVKGSFPHLLAIGFLCNALI